MNYTLHQLRIFMEVCDNESITRAAEALYLTQPAVSIQLKKLQQQFEVPLFEVIGRQLHITSFGRQIYTLARDMLQKADDIRAAADEHRGILTGAVHIATASTGKYVLPYFLTGFVRQHPGVSLTVDVTNKSLVVDSLRENRTDFAVVSVTPKNIRLQRTPLLPNELYLAAAADYPGIPDRMTPKRLSNFPLIYREPGSATRAAMERYLSDKKVNVGRSMTLQSNEAVKQAVLAGLGLSILPKIGIRTELHTGAMKIIPMHGLPLLSEWALVHVRGKRLKPAAVELIRHIEAAKAEVIARRFTDNPAR